MHGVRTVGAWGLLWLAAAAAAHAQTPLTSDLVHFAGGHWTGETSRLGIVTWSAREAGPSPLPLTLSSRGGRQLLFFDPAPLIDVDAAADETSLRAALGLSSGQALPPADPMQLPAAITSLRRMVRATMRDFQLATLADLAATVACQRRHEEAGDGSVALVIDLLSCAPAFSAGARDAAAAAAFVRQRRLLRPVLRSHAAFATRHVAGYFVEHAGAGPGGAAEIRAAAGNAREETVLTLTFAAPTATGLQSDAAKLFVPPLFTLLGIVVTALVGFQVFKKQQVLQFKYFLRQQRTQFGYYLNQQRYQEERAAADRFQQRKYEQFAPLSEFFDNTYPPIIDNDIVKPADLVKRLIQANVYRVMPAAGVDELNRICSADLPPAEARRRIDEVLRKHFGEFMRAR